MRPLAWLAVALLATALAGCADSSSGKGPPPTVADGEADRLSRGRGTDVGDVVVEGRSALDANNGTGPITNLTGITQLFWATTASLPGLALELSLDFGKDNKCELGNDVSVRVTGPAIHYVTVEESESGGGWGTGSSGSTASAHAGPVDTRSVTSGEGHAGGGSGSSGTFSGPLRMTLLASNLDAWDNPFLEKGVSAAFSITCDNPFDVLGTRGGSQVLLGGPSTWTGGAGGEVFLVGEANAGDSMSGSFTSPQVRAMAGGFGAHVAQLLLDHPGGQETWTFLPDFPVAVGDSLFAYEGAPGDYTITATQSGAYLDALWAGVWGFDGPYDLRPGLRFESALRSPF